MVTGYNLELDEKFFRDFELYKKKGDEILKPQVTQIKSKLDNYIINGIVDGTKLSNDWFPETEADIFISHSHQDKKLAIALAGWLYDTFELKCFIDSCVWGYADDLLEIINTQYSDKEEKANGGYVYNHTKCNTASKHVNTMLSVALHRMIDKAEVTILLNTSNSIERYSDVYDNTTYSPWIYLEIIFSELVRKKQISEYRFQNVLEHSIEKNYAKMDDYISQYQVSLDHLEKLNGDILNEWEKIYENHSKKIESNGAFDYPLDDLYNLTYGANFGI